MEMNKKYIIHFMRELIIIPEVTNLVDNQMTDVMVISSGTVINGQYWQEICHLNTLVVHSLQMISTKTFK